MVQAETRLSHDELRLRTVQRRGVESVVWGIPAVNYSLMLQAAARELQCGPNQIVYWSELLDWRNQTLTPNPDAVYLMPFLNTNHGPVVLEIPPAESGAIIGSVMDGWQVPLEDVGQAGVDQGAGGKYLILPPVMTGRFQTGSSHCDRRLTVGTRCCAPVSPVEPRKISEQPLPTARKSGSTRSRRPTTHHGRPTSTPPTTRSTRRSTTT